MVKIKGKTAQATPLGVRTRNPRTTQQNLHLKRREVLGDRELLTFSYALHPAWAQAQAQPICMHPFITLLS